MKIDLNIKKLLPHVIAIVIFLVLGILYCKPVLDGLAIEQPDTIQYRGMAQDAENYRTKNGIYPLWTKNMFGGMPTYNIAYPSNAAIPYIAIKLLGLWLPEPFIYFFLACTAFYFLSQVLRVNTWIGVLGAIGFAYCSYDPIIIAVGHHTKMMTMAVMPALLASIILLYEKRYWLGGALTAMFTSSLVVFNHLQIVYYMLIVILFVSVAYAIVWIKNKNWKHLIIAGSAAVLAAGMGVLACSVNILTTKDYAKETIRGGRANLGTDTSTNKKPTTGLDINYAFAWSYGLPETFTLLIPNVNGGSSEGLGEDSKFYETLIGKVQSKELDQNLAQQIGQFGTAYWGKQTLGTSGPVYLGAIICFLFVLGAVCVKSIHKWWILAACALFIMMAWGSHFMIFNKFLFEHLPMYNSFRVPTLSLVVPQFLFPILGMLGLQQLIFTEDEKQKWKYLKLTGIITGGIFLLAIAYFFSTDYSSGNEKDVLKQIATSNPQLVEPVKDVFKAAGEDRQELFKTDLQRSILIAGLGFLVLFLFVKQKMKPIIPITALLLLSTFDLLAVGRRYLNDDKYAEKDNTEVINYVQVSNPRLYKVLTEIQQDTDPHYRVYNEATGSTFDDALSSAFVRSIGGYHPAKLSVYEDLRDNITRKHNINVYNMLDTRYFILNGQNGPEIHKNPDAFGAAWLVKHILFVPDAKTEMKSLDSMNLRDSAIVQQQFKTQITALPQWDSTASIKLVNYNNNEIEYAVKADKPQFAVLSEVYYSRGWNAYANGEKIPIVKTNYTLRGVALPAGTQKLDLKFEPESFRIGYAITAVSGYLIVLIFFLGIFMEYKTRKKAK